MRPLPGAGIAIVCAAVATVVTPEPGFTPALGFAGWPRLGLYALGGVALALTACSPKQFDKRIRVARRVGKRPYLLVGAGVGASVLLTAVNAQRLTANIADPLGPALWLASMLVLLGYMLFPQVQRIGWDPLWPMPTKVPNSRWLVLLGLLVLASATRLPALADIPQGINPDEGDRTATAFDVLDGLAPVSWFDSGWFFINMIYFRVLAASLVLFGRDVAGGRMLSALCGIAFVAVIAWLGCRNFGWRVGLLATAFATGLMMTIQHSRLITEAGPTTLLWAISIGCFLEGTRYGRLWAWALAGLAGGLGLYFYPSARLWAVGAICTVLVVLLYQRERRLLLGVAVAGLASVVAAAPFLIHLTRHTNEITGRYAQTAVVDPHNQERLAYLRPPEPLPELFALQFERTVGMFDRYPDGGGFLPTGHPIFGVPLAQLTLIGAVYLLVRAWRDVRLAVLSLWFWLGLSGVALTVETPDYLRSVGMLPSLCFVLAIPLLDLVDRLLRARLPQRRTLTAVLPAAVACVLLVPEVVSYFATFRTLPVSWGPETRDGQLVAALGADGPVYTLEMNEHMVNSGWVRLLAPHAARGRMPNPGRELPVLGPAGAAVQPGELRPDFVPATGEGFSVIFSPDPNQRPYFQLLQGLYPQAVLTEAGDGRQMLRVSPQALAATQGVTVVDTSGSSWAVDTFGRIPPGVALPADLTWRAGVRFPRAGVYHVSISAPGAARVHINHEFVIVGSRSDADFQSAAGVHYLELEAHVVSQGDQVALTLGGSELSAFQTYRPMDGPWGLQAHLNRLWSDPLGARIDSAVAMAFFDPELGFVVVPNSLIWTGSLIAPRSGTYRMAFASEDTMHLQVDGEAVDVVTVTPEGWQSVGIGSQVQLSAGPHRVQVTLDISHGGRELARWNWVPPLESGAMDTGAGWSVVPPQVLRPETAANP